jgi:hypothetical protein
MSDQPAATFRQPAAMPTRLGRAKTYSSRSNSVEQQGDSVAALDPTEACEIHEDDRSAANVRLAQLRDRSRQVGADGGVARTLRPAAMACRNVQLLIAHERTREAGHED